MILVIVPDGNWSYPRVWSYLSWWKLVVIIISNYYTFRYQNHSTSLLISFLRHINRLNSYSSNKFAFRQHIHAQQCLWVTVSAHVVVDWFALQSVLIEQTSTPEEFNRGTRAIPETIRKSRRITYMILQLRVHMY